MAPKRWIESGEATPFEREVLASGSDDAPPPGEEERVWAQVVPWLGPLPPAGAPGNPVGNLPAAPGAPAAAGAGAAGGGSLVTSVGPLGALLVGFGGGVIVTGILSVATLRPAPAPVAPVATLAAVEASPSATTRPRDDGAPPPRVRETAQEPRGAEAVPPAARSAALPEAEAAPESSVAAFDAVDDSSTPRAPTAAEQLQLLREEARLMQQARAAFQQGELGRAFALLEASRTRFPGGKLAQEREVLTIELLFGSGQQQAARVRAADFLARYPDSPHAARVRRVLDAH